MRRVYFGWWSCQADGAPAILSPEAEASSEEEDNRSGPAVAIVGFSERQAGG